jgi:hypothetical protein
MQERTFRQIATNGIRLRTVVEAKDLLLFSFTASAVLVSLAPSDRPLGERRVSGGRA